MNNQYISSFQFIGNSVKSFKIKNDFISFDDEAAFKKKLDVFHSVQEIEEMEEGNVLSGVLQLNIKVVFSEGKKKYTIDLTMEGCFIAPSEIGKDAFEKMLSINGLTSLYSVARGFVQSVTAQTVLSGSVLLPMFNVVAYSRDLNAKKTEEK